MSTSMPQQVCQIKSELKSRVKRGKIITNDEDGGVVSEEYSRVRRKD